MSVVLWYIAKFVTVGLIGLIVSFISNRIFSFWRRYRLIQKLPGPKGIFFFGSTLEMAKIPVEDAMTWISNHMKNYERLMKMWFVFISNVYIIEPDDIQELLNNTRHIKKGVLYTYLKPWLGEGLITSSGEKWHSRRKLLTPSFHFKILEDNMTVFNKYSKILCEKLKESNGSSVAIHSYISSCTLDIIMSTAMSKDIHSQTENKQGYVRNLKITGNMISHRVMRLHLFWDWAFKISEVGRKFFKAVSSVHSFTNNVIKQKKGQFKTSEMSSKKSYKAFLDVMLELESRYPGSLNDNDLSEEVATFMFAGHDTTSMALIYIIYNLAKYSDIQKRVFEELKDIFGDSDRDVSERDLNKMIYLEKVIKESLRLYPSVPGITRLLENDLVLKDGVILPAGTNILTLIYLVHRNPKYWENPDIFDPERFSEEQIQSRHPYSYLPFSAGPRNCIGQKFAMMELKTVVSTVIRQLKIIPVTRDEDFKFIFSVVLRTNKQIMCKFIPR